MVGLCRAEAVRALVVFWRWIEGRVKTMRRRLLFVVIDPGLAAAVWLAIGAVGAWQFRAELREATRDLAARRVDQGQGATGPAGRALARSRRGRVLARRL